MISRVAEGCFWLSRYLERMETLARLLDVYHALHIDAGLPIDGRWRRLLEFTVQVDDFREKNGGAALDDGEAVQHYLTWQEDHPTSLYTTLRGARENARTVREVMSLEAWKSINDLWLWLQGRESRRLYDSDRGSFYEQLMRATHLFHGVSFATMLHDEPYTFMKLGRAAERAGQTARILETHADPGAGEHGGGGAPTESAAESAASCLAVLRCCCAYDPYFLSGRQPLSMQTVMRFLLFDRTLPRSVLYNLDEARRLLFALRGNDPVGLPRRSRTVLERFRGQLLQMDVSDVERLGIHEALAWTIQSADQLCEAIHDDYLDPPTPWLRHCVRALEAIEGEPERDSRAA